MDPNIVRRNYNRGDGNRGNDKQLGVIMNIPACAVKRDFWV
jgi:hypothetical protein